jgi:alkyl sulfatase BDS1-like metallo-beta-lactamase superfamily hydrolase
MGIIAAGVRILCAFGLCDVFSVFGHTLRPMLPWGRVHYRMSGWLRIAFVSLLLVLPACNGDRQVPEPPAPVHPDLAQHTEEFKPEVIEVTDGVHVAVGYGLANSIMIEGEGGVIIVDTMESAKAAKRVKAEFAKITDDPVRAIIYTHNHADHVFGSEVFADGEDVEIYAHATTLERLSRIVNVLRPTIFTRSMRQFGVYLSDSARINCGVGPKLEFDRDTQPSLLLPTRTFEDERTELHIAGVDIVLVHAPGETPDQIFVWLPAKKVLLPGDNFYKSFPNLYAIRGTSYRDVMDWVRTLDKMRDMRPQYLVPSHTRPVVGAENIEAVLTDYRDAIQFVHDQTLRHMNAGLTADEIVERVRLPHHLASKPHLQEFYGRVDWSVRSIFTGYLGWFGGNATDLDALGAAERGKRMAALAGGIEELRSRATDAFDTGDHQWALVLADSLLALDPADEVGRRVRVGSLRGLAEETVSANGRNYYLTQALEAEGAIEIEPQDPADAPADLLRMFPIGDTLQAMPGNLDPDKSRHVDSVIQLIFTDVDETYTMHVRRGVAELRKKTADSPDITVTCDSFVWKQILVGQRSAAAAYATGKLAVDGSAIDLAKILLMFEAD